MIGYVTLGSNNIEKAAKFYDELLGEMGAKRDDGIRQLCRLEHRAWRAGRFGHQAE